ncbi:hypothetical protein HPA02_27270 [Bisbaumannia pacifica]|uniref:Uncharacterized protein n=1 Tax=Bisbaumannia pacifica TaxID=77098 RepID=A0A510XAI4_9GAMM|nr:Gp49 family protein [Halomonas pacifica]GEK48444.1 hypothetical protein HPA02_27270 [Halomonas pacifica]
MATHLIHGFNVSDGGRGSVGRLAPWMPRPRRHDYGWTFLFRLRWVNENTVDELLPLIAAGDVLVAHSNGCLIAWHLVQRGAPVSAVVCIQPALRRDTEWPEHLPVLCLHNRDDWIVSLGRAWGRFVSVANPFRDLHGWGAAGRHGFASGQPLVTNWDTDRQPFPALGHSGAFRQPALGHWAPLVAAWVNEKVSIMNDDQQVEQQIQAKGLNAPRVTPDALDAKIIGEDYHVFPGTTVTVCLLRLENGFTVTGESACASPENFDPELGREIARRNAREKIWMLEGYLLREQLHRGEA